MQTFRHINHRGRLVERTITDSGFMIEREVEDPTSWKLNDAKNEIMNIERTLYKPRLD